MTDTLTPRTDALEKNIAWLESRIRQLEAFPSAKRTTTRAPRTLELMNRRISYPDGYAYAVDVLTLTIELEEELSRVRKERLQWKDRSKDLEGFLADAESERDKLREELREELKCMTILRDGAETRARMILEGKNEIIDKLREELAIVSVQHQQSLKTRDELCEELAHYQRIKDLRTDEVVELYTKNGELREELESARVLLGQGANIIIEYLPGFDHWAHRFEEHEERFGGRHE